MYHLCMPSGICTAGKTGRRNRCWNRNGIAEKVITISGSKLFSENRERIGLPSRPSAAFSVAYKIENRWIPGRGGGLLSENPQRKPFPGFPLRIKRLIGSFGQPATCLRGCKNRRKYNPLCCFGQELPNRGLSVLPVRRGGFSVSRA